VVQLIAGVFALLCRDSAAATLMLSFATTWLVDALVFWLRPPGTAEALGIFWIVFAVFVAIMLTSALPKGALAAVLAVAAPYFLVSGIAEITGSRPVAHAAAVLGYLWRPWRCTPRSRCCGRTAAARRSLRSAGPARPGHHGQPGDAAVGLRAAGRRAAHAMTGAGAGSIAL
jgi:hypothetical protein